MKDRYEIKFKVKSEGSIIDLSEAIRYIELIQSIKHPIAIFRIDISQQVSTIDIEEAELEIKFKNAKQNILESYQYTLIPAKKKLSINLKQDQTAVPYRGFTPLFFYEKRVHNSFTKRIQSRLLRNKTVEQVLKDLDNRIEIIGKSKKDKVIPQIYIPTMSLSSAIKYVMYHFGLFDETYIIQFYYDPIEVKDGIKLVNLTDKFRKEDYSGIIFVITKDFDSNMLQKYLEDNRYTYTYLGLHHTSMFDSYSDIKEIVFTEKPINDLYKVYNYDFIDMIKKHGLSNNSIQFEDKFKNYRHTLISIRNHTGGTSLHDAPVKSMLLSDIRSMKEITIVTLNDKLLAFPGEVVFVKCLNPEFIEYEGFFVLDLIHAKFQWKDALWDASMRYNLQVTV